MQIFRHLKSIIDLQGMPSKNRRVVLFSEGNNHWNFIKPIAKYLIDHKSRLAPIYVTQSVNDRGLATVDQEIPAFVVGSKSVRDYLLSNIECDFLITSTPELGLRRVRRSPLCKHYAYVQHSINSLHMAYQEGAFNFFDTVFCSGSHHQREIDLICALFNLPKKRVIEMRYEPIFELRSLTDAYHEESHRAVRPINHALIAPTWSEHSLIEGNVVLPYIKKFLDLGIKVTLRPHPETTKHNYRLITRIEEDLRDQSGFTLNLDLTHTADLLEADVLLTDWSGVAFDFALGLGKPVLFVDTPPKVHNKNYGRIDEIPIEERCRDFLGIRIKSALELPEALSRLETGSVVMKRSFERFFDKKPELALEELFRSALVEQDHLM